MRYHILYTKMVGKGTTSVRLGKVMQRDLSKVEKKWQTDRSEAIRRLLAVAIKEWKIQNALGEIAAHKISVGKAAEDCDISIWEMLDIIKEKNIDWTGYSDEDLKKDLEALE